MTAPRRADVGARDPQPLEIRGRGKHPLEQLPVAGLDLGSLAEGAARLGDPGREGVADPLQLAEADQPRLASRGWHPDVDLDTGKRLGGKAAELVLEAADLAPQLGASEALVAPYANSGEGLSVEQLRHELPRV